MTTLALIPARAGSKRLRNKNTLPFAGKPLIAWTIQAAIAAGVDRVIVSTDGERIANVAAEYGAEVLMRPEELASDSADTLSVVKHALSIMRASTLVLLQPTSPLRTPDDIRGCLALHAETGRPVVTVAKASPWLFWHNESGLQRISAPPDAEAVHPNGAVYVCSVKAIREGKTWYDGPMPYLMPEERSVDIDTQVQFDVAEALARRRVAEHINLGQALLAVTS